jgi:hypothetical protein
MFVFNLIELCTQTCEGPPTQALAHHSERTNQTHRLLQAKRFISLGKVATEGIEKSQGRSERKCKDHVNSFNECQERLRTCGRRGREDIEVTQAPYAHIKGEQEGSMRKNHCMMTLHTLHKHMSMRWVIMSPPSM